MKNIQKGFAIIPTIIIIALLLLGGAYIALNNQESAQKAKNIMQNDFNSSDFEQNKNWSTYMNQKVGFAISYPAKYHVYLDNNIINYDENKFERGNPIGIKIQIQRHSKENYGYDLSTNDGIKKFIGKLNETIAKNDAFENSNSTLAVPFSLGVLKFKNKVLSGPGGAFNIYYAFSNNDTYYTVLVWGEKNDQETVNKILSTLKIIADSANQTNTQSSVQKSMWETYTNSKYSFSIKHPSDWNIVVKENDANLGSLISLKFTIGKSGNVDYDEFLGLIGCFGGMNNVDPFYLGSFRSSEPIEIDGVLTLINYDQNRGLETLKFYLPLIKQDSNRCGIFFQSFTKLTEIKKEIITSLDFTNGFEAFINDIVKQFQTNPPTKG